MINATFSKTDIVDIQKMMSERLAKSIDKEISNSLGAYIFDQKLKSIIKSINDNE